MMLYILRHATAEEAASSGDDGARKLTERSKEKMRGAAAGLRAMVLKFDAILTSPLVRAAETAEIVSAAYENTPPPQVLPALATGVTAADAVAALRAFAKHGEVMIVGHEPQLSAVASILLTGAGDAAHMKLKTGGCIAIDLPARFERGGGELRWMLTHRQLRQMRK
ncbi:phosphohistidine phosphatase SixA [Candidatus Binatus sp.]|jgi:phosphohistidine phosphatase|uniref:phosphohistidine phosphatase SixA n=1 Tax=Candidatus Binatus sp. TaxID=2811406 RepID=UPI003BD1035F